MHSQQAPRLITHEIAPGPRRRHQARVQRFSDDPDLLDTLDTLSVVDAEALRVVDEVCVLSGVESPTLRFHASRSPYTGVTEQPRWWLVDAYSEERVRGSERETKRPFPPHGAIRLGRVTTLMTVAHELGHHLVFVLDPQATPAHGRRWVLRFDQVAAAIRGML